MKKYIIKSLNILFWVTCQTIEAPSQQAIVIVEQNIPKNTMTFAPKLIIHENKMWLYRQMDKQAGEIITHSINAKDTVINSYDNFIFGYGGHPFASTIVSWDIGEGSIYGLHGLTIRFNVGYCYGASGQLNKIPIKELPMWTKNMERNNQFNYQTAFELGAVSRLPISTWFEKKYYDGFLKSWQYQTPYKEFGFIADSVIRNTYFDFFKLKSNDSTSFFALCEGNVLSAWHFDRSKQQKLREYPFKPTGYFHVLEHQNKPYLISAEGTVFKIGRRLKKVQQLPRPLKDGWLIVDKDHDKIYFLEQQYFAFADKPRAISEILKNAFVIF